MFADHAEPLIETVFPEIGGVLQQDNSLTKWFKFPSKSTKNECEMWNWLRNSSDLRPAKHLLYVVEKTSRIHLDLSSYCSLREKNRSLNFLLPDTKEWLYRPIGVS